MATKTCNRCEQTLSTVYFYANSEGHLSSKCKECTKKAVRENRAKKLAYYREYDRNRYREHGHRYRNGPSKEASNRAKRSYEKRNKEKCDAKTILGNALRDGKIERQPCCICGSPDSQAHHEDYSKPLAVVWLCPEHHAQHHRIIDRLAEVLADEQTEAV